MKVYTYEHIDFYGAFVRPESLFWEYPELFEQREKSREAFLKARWEGDGTIEVIWIPPFVLSGDTHGTFLWHVKQRNNGTSFIACDRKLPFKWLWAVKL